MFKIFDDPFTQLHTAIPNATRPVTVDVEDITNLDGTELSPVFHARIQNELLKVTAVVVDGGGAGIDRWTMDHIGGAAASAHGVGEPVDVVVTANGLTAGLADYYMALGTGITNPLTTKGDVIYSSDNSGTPARLGIGTNEYVLTVDTATGIPKWKASAGGGGGGGGASIPSSRTKRNAALVLTTDGAWHIFPFDSVVSDTGGFFTTASRYTAGTTGTYLLQGFLGKGAPGTDMYISIYKNGTLYEYASATDRYHNLFSGTIDLVATDYVEIAYNQFGGDTTSSTGNDQAYWSVTFLGAVSGAVLTGSTSVTIPGLAGSPDIKVGGTNDDEFDQNAAGTPAGWTAFGTPDTVDTNTAKSRLHLKSASNGAVEGIKGVLKAAPSMPFTVTAKFDGVGVAGPWADFGNGGLCVLDAATTNKSLGIALGTNAGLKIYTAYTHSNWTTYGGSVTTAAIPQIAPLYFRMVVHSATNIDFFASWDGLTWVAYDAGVNYLANATYVGIFINPYSRVTELFCDWIRFS